MRIGLLIALLLGIGSAPGAAAGTPPIPAAVDEYARAARADTIREVEGLYRLGLRAAEDLVGPGSDILEELSDSDFVLVQEKMRWFAVTRDEVVFVEADSDSFAELARRCRDTVSRDFFETAKQVTYDGYAAWPAYVEQVTDYSGCTKFGSLELVRCYRLLTRFRTLHPNRYRDRIDRLLEPLEEDLTSGDCPCGVREDVVYELRAFLSEFPKAPIAPSIRERLTQIETGKLSIRDHCSPG